MTRLLAALLLLVLLPATAAAQNTRAMRAQVEASMLVTGHVDIDRAGQVTAHVLDQRERLPDYVVSLVDRAVPQLRFEPVQVDGEPALARAKMSLRLVARKVGDGEMKIAIRSAHFGEDGSSVNDGSIVRAASMPPPSFPQSVIQQGGKGTVYLLVKVGRDGTVEDVAVEQVNLTVVADARTVQSVRDRLAKAAVAGARRWTFTPPSTGDDVDEPYWGVRVPVEFAFIGDRSVGYGEWSAYLPGPRHRPAWAQPDAPGFSPDSLVAGTVHGQLSRFRLLTPLEG